MQRLVRISLMWLIVFAIPAQGIAAASMALCGPGHAAMLGSPASSPPSQHAHDPAHHPVGNRAHDQAQAQAQSQIHHQVHGTGHDGGMAGAYGHPHHAAGPGPADPPGQLSPAGSADSLADLDQLSDLTCNVCAACCAALALPSHDSSFRPSAAPPIFVTLHRAGRESFFPSGLDRPPRHFLA